MNFSSVAIQQRQKKAKVLKSFLAFSLRVLVRVVADANSNVTSAQVARSSGNSALDEAALKQARRRDQGSARPVTMSFNFSQDCRHQPIWVSAVEVLIPAFPRRKRCTMLYHVIANRSKVTLMGVAFWW